VGKSYWIQTPAKEFILEPHYVTPFIHWFPKHMQKRLLRNFSLYGWLERPTEACVDKVLAELRLLNYAEFSGLFGDSRICVERVVGLPKSYTAYKLPGDGYQGRRESFHGENLDKRRLTSCGL